VKRILGIVVVALAVSVPASVRAGQLGTQIPSNCVAHTSFDGGADLVDDFRCAGLAIDFHTAGVTFSPALIWAGQWLFTDESGQFRVGSCTFNRGIHPTIDAPSFPVAQLFPNDPTGAKGAYLTWRYGDTTDDLLAAGMWAVFHYYAQDSAGTRRAVNPIAPLIPSLGMIAGASGRDDIQTVATALDAEATRFVGDWAIAISLGIDGAIDLAVTGGVEPVAGAIVTLLVSGQDAPIVATTDEAGLVHATMGVSVGPMTVVASTPVPGPVAVYRGTPAGPDPHGAQRLVTGGVPGVVSATATVDVPPPPTTTTTMTTTTIPPTTTTTTTTIPPTTTTIPPTTTSTTTSTIPATTTTTTIPPTTTTISPAETTVPEVVPLVEVLAAPPAAPLPNTGAVSDLISYLGTSLLVAGVGIVGVARRRPPPNNHRWSRADRL
jgi:LPXTG-motif cell wall-anchored protein